MIRRWSAAMVVVALFSWGCLPASVREAASPDRIEHERTVDDLEHRSDEEDGWVVVPLPNLHEGGGLTTWWLQPCDPERDESRVVTRTAYHGSDVADLPGMYEVETDQLPCRPPAAELEIGGRRLILDVEVVRLGGSVFGLLAERERVELSDVDLGVVREAQTGAQPVHGPCDGRTHWSASLDSARSLSVSVDSCAGDLAALPPEALELLDLAPDTDTHRTSFARVPASREPALLDALRDAGFQADGDQLEGVLRGPCAPTADPRAKGDSQSLIDVNGGYVTVSERPCR